LSLVICGSRFFGHEKVPSSKRLLRTHKPVPSLWGPPHKGSYGNFGIMGPRLATVRSARRKTHFRFA
jgi:hypothetical protein